ncbi:putative zinc-binding metallopeptidase [Patescibacteria group bacterium]|nr:putative zinc-binding metallopeptidase [Patescibacteria group bacterium]
MPKTTSAMATEPASESTTHEVAQQETSLELDFSARNFSESQISLNATLQEQIIEAMEVLPSSHAETVEKIILDYNQQAHRGLGGNNLVILRGVNMGIKELVAVLIHETGHNVDYGYLVEKNEDEISEFKDGNYPLYITDPSIDFYRISWENETTLKNTSSNLDFVSGYAMSDPFEDFAETYVYYVLHNADFRTLTASSPDLYAKYRFMKYRVFDGVEFDTGDAQVNLNNRPWDITVLSYDLEELLS